MSHCGQPVSALQRASSDGVGTTVPRTQVWVPFPKSGVYTPGGEAVSEALTPGQDQRPAQSRSPSAPYSQPHSGEPGAQGPAPREGRASASRLGPHPITGSPKLLELGHLPAAETGRGARRGACTPALPQSLLPRPRSPLLPRPPLRLRPSRSPRLFSWGRSRPGPAFAPRNFSTAGLWRVECSRARTHGRGSEARAGTSKSRGPPGWDAAAAAVPGLCPDRAHLQRGHRERAALPGAPGHPLRLLGGVAQPRGEPLVSRRELGSS